MYCENCGNKIKEGHQFCMKCGNPVTQEDVVKVKAESIPSVDLDKKWWLRLARVMYIVLYIPLPFVVWIAWTINASTYDYYSSSYSHNYGSAFWYSLITLVIYVAVVRLIKITFLYVAFAQKTQWKREFRRLF